jgi:hypothetical protein
MGEIAQGTETSEQPLDIDLADHHAAEQHEFVDRRAHAPEIAAEPAAVECLGDDGAALDRRSRKVVAIVRMIAAGDEAKLGAGHEVVDHAGPVGEERGAARIVAAVADQRVEISPGIGGAVVVARVPAGGILGDPQRTRRRRAGAAEQLRLLANQRVEPFQRRHQRRRHAAGPGARDQHIDLAVPSPVIHPCSFCHAATVGNRSWGKWPPPPISRLTCSVASVNLTIDRFQKDFQPIEITR